MDDFPTLKFQLKDLTVLEATQDGIKLTYIMVGPIKNHHHIQPIYSGKPIYDNVD